LENYGYICGILFLSSSRKPKKATQRSNELQKGNYLKTLAIFIAFTLTLLASSKRDWQDGQLLNVERQTVGGGGPVAIATANPGSTEAAGAAAQQAQAASNLAIAAAQMPHARQILTVQGGGVTYIVSRPVGLHDPVVTINRPIRYAVEHNKFYILDEDQKEFKLTILEKRAMP
jgi:hypothetical protein